MHIQNITYKTQCGNENEVFLHLNYCNNSFIPPLNTRVDLKEYSKKIYNNAVTFEAWHDQRLIGLIATYFNKEDNFGFITSVSLAKEYSGVGIASKLLEMCVEYAAKHHYDELKLEVNNDNIPAVNFYKKYNFTQIDINKDSLMMKYILKNK